MSHIIAFVCGLLLWTLLEYAVHRWLFHGVLLKYHRHHHNTPKIPKPMPLWALALPLLGIFWISVGLGLGVLTGLAAYEALHQYLHHGNPKRSWLLHLRAQHMKHHRIPSKQFGVVTNFWDRIFRTSL